MKRWCTSLLVTAMVLAGVFAALTTRPAAAADDAIVSADRAVTAAFEKGDKAAINKWVDPEFTWIDTQGIMCLCVNRWKRTSNRCTQQRDIKVIEHKYGSVVWVQSNLGKNYARIPG